MNDYALKYRDDYVFARQKELNVNLKSLKTLAQVGKIQPGKKLHPG